jgi:PHP family Zn ribbon phosphoesterase
MSEETNYWRTLSKEQADIELQTIIARAQAFEGLQLEGEITVIEPTRTQGFREDKERQARVEKLLRCFSEDIRKLIAFMALLWDLVKLKDDHIQWLEAQIEQESKLSFGERAAQLLGIAREQGIKNFIRQQIGDNETREVFTVEVRREKLSPEEVEQFFAESVVLGEQP